MEKNKKYHFSKTNNIKPKSCKKCFNFYLNLKNGFCTKCLIQRNFKSDLNIFSEKNNEDILFNKKIKTLKIDLKQFDHNKCWICQKKLGIRGFKCRCTFTFCKKHKMPEEHKCKFDFKKAGKKNLKKELTFRKHKIKKI